MEVNYNTLKDVLIFLDGKRYWDEPILPVEGLQDTEIQWVEYPHAVFWDAMLITGGISFLLFFLSFFISPRFFWRKDFPEKDQVMWHACFSSLFMSTRVFIAVIEESINAGWFLYDSLWVGDGNLFLGDYKATKLTYWTTGVSAGYVGYDLLVYLMFPKPMIASGGAKLYWQIVAHHVTCMLALFFMPAARRTSAPFIFHLLVEATNILLNINWLLDRMHWRRFIGVFRFLFFVLFTVGRIIPIFLLIPFFLDPKQWVKHSTFQFVLAVVIYGTNYSLNLFWYSFLLKKVMQMMKIGWKVEVATGALAGQKTQEWNGGAAVEMKKKK